jgi:hypothetical protein
MSRSIYVVHICLLSGETLLGAADDHCSAIAGLHAGPLIREDIQIEP